MNSRLVSLFASASLVLTALLWGISYSAQAEAMDYLQPLFFVSLRYFLGSILLIIPVILRWFKTPDKQKLFSKKLLLSGGCCGIFLAGGEILQQFGLLYTSAGKAGFLTALYVIMIPLIGVVCGKKTVLKVWIAALLSVGGTYLLCFDGGFDMVNNRGDVLVLICALFFAFQFMAIGKFAPEADALQLSYVQFFTVAVVSGIAALVAGESCQLRQIVNCGVPLLYCGAVAIGFACTVQVAAQKFVQPATASIILSTASVFAVLWGWLLRGEVYSAANLTGCAIIFLAVVLIELPERRKS